MKKRFIILFVVMLLLLQACGGSASQSNTNFDDQETIKLGFIGCITGDAAIYAETSLNGVNLAINEINANGGILGKNIELVIEDDKNDTTEAINAYNKIREEGVLAIIGSITSAPGEAFAPLAMEDGMPMLTPTGTQFNITEGRDNVFRVCFTDPFQGEILAQYAKDLGAKTVAVMKNNSSDYSDGVYQAFKDKVSELGLEIVADESYGDADTDFRVQLTKIKDANPDLLMVPDYYEKDALIISQARELGIDKTILGPDGWDGILKQVEKSNYSYLDNLYFSNHYSLDDTNEKVQSFIENYKRTYNEEPLSFSALSYDAVYIYKEAIENAGELNQEKIIDAMKNINFSGVTGDLVFDENNNPVKSVSMIKIEDDEYRLEKVVTTE